MPSMDTILLFAGAAGAMLLLFAALATATAGMAALALAINVHWRQLFSAKAQTAAARSLCQVAGAALLALSFALCVMADPVSMALLVWPMQLGAGAAIVAAALTLQARLSPAGRKAARGR